MFTARNSFEKPPSTISVFRLRKELVGVIGHTGSGKSHLVQQLNGLLKPTSGKVLLKGKDIWVEPKKIRAIRFQVGWCSNTRSTSFLRKRWKRISRSAQKIWGFRGRNQAAGEMAAAFAGLKDNLLGASPFEISGGEKRRAAIAGVIAMDPEVLILDEPTAGLDPMGRDVLLFSDCGLSPAKEQYCFAGFHSMEDIARIADRVLVIDDGKVAMFEKNGQGVCSKRPAVSNGTAGASNH